MDSLDDPYQGPGCVTNGLPVRKRGLENRDARLHCPAGKAMRMLQQCERNAQFERVNGGTAQHALVAPWEPAREPSGRFVVELTHRRLRERLYLLGRDAGINAVQRLWRNSCLPERLSRVRTVLLVSQHHGSDEGHRRGSRRSVPHACSLQSSGTICNQIGAACASHALTSG